MDSYIARLNKYLGPDHPSTQGFTIIQNLIDRGAAPEIGIFYSGKRDRILHDLVLYSLGDSLAEFAPIPADRNLLNCLENAVETAEKLRNPATTTDHLVILPFDEAALRELHTLQKEMQGREFHINGRSFHYLSVPLTEQKTNYERLAAPENMHTKPEIRLSLQAEALRQGIIARYKSAQEKLDADTEKKNPTPNHPANKTAP